MKHKRGASTRKDFVLFFVGVGTTNLSVCVYSFLAIYEGPSFKGYYKRKGDRFSLI